MHSIPEKTCLSTKSIQSLALTLEGVDDIHGSHGLATSVLGVGDGIANNILQKDLEDTTGLLINQPRDALDAATAGETADGGLGNALDIVAQDLAVTLGAALSKSLASFSSACVAIQIAIDKTVGETNAIRRSQQQKKKWKNRVASPKNLGTRISSAIANN